MACTLPLRVRNAVLMGACAMATVGGVMEIVNPSKVQVDIFKLASLAKLLKGCRAEPIPHSF